MRKWLSLVLCVMVLFLGLLPGAIADTDVTTLQISLYGMTLLPTGQWRSDALSGVFYVYQEGASVGKLTVNSFGSTKLTLNSGSEVTLIPEEGSITDGYLVEETGYTLSIESGINNTAHIIAYSNNGLFDVYADGVQSFRVTRAGDASDEDAFYFTADRFSMTFQTNEEGIFSLADPIPADNYIKIGRAHV